MNEVISVIVPVYNVERYLNRCIESIVNQTYSNLEIILVDDESPDKCPQMCDEWAHKDERIKVIHKKNQGLGFARNSGIDVSTGEYVFFVDSDDYLPLDAIEALYCRIIKDKTDLAIGQHFQVFDNDEKNHLMCSWYKDIVIGREEALKMIGSKVTTLPCYAWAKLYKKFIFNNLRFEKVTCAEDEMIFPDIIDVCTNISIVAKVVYYYYQRETSILHTMSYTKIMDNIRAKLYVGRYLMNYGFILSAKTYFQSAVGRIADIKNNKEALLLLNKTFSKEDIRKFGKFSFGFRLLYFSIYVPYLSGLIKKLTLLLRKQSH